jgi:hypothetical protein
MIRKLTFAFLLATVVPAAAWAGAFQTIGPHIGFSSGPDQVILGGQLQMGDVAPQVDLLPGIDVGFGDDMTLVSLNGDFHYRFQLSNSTWQPYVGGGVAVTFGEGDSAAGGSFIGGADVPTKSGNRFFVEGKIGFGDVYDIKFLAGWHFPL